MAAVALGWQPGNGLIPRPDQDKVGNYQGYKIVSDRNSKADIVWYKQIQNFFGEANGAYRAVQVFEKSTKFVSEAARLADATKTHEFLKDKGDTFSRVANGFVLPYTAFAAIEVFNSGKTVATEGGANGKIEKLFKNALDFLVALCYSTMLFNPGAKVLGNIATVADLGADGIDLTLHAKEYHQVCKIQDLAPNALSVAMRTDLAAKKKQHLLGLFKMGLCVAGGIIGVLGIIYSVAVLPAIVTLGLSLMTTITKIVDIFAKNNMARHVVIERLPQQVAAPVEAPVRPAAAVAATTPLPAAKAG